jgi:DNA-binding CsgD family transcriptional regulator
VGSRFLETLAAEAGPRGLLLTGAAGIGKTAVWREVVDQGRARGIPVLAASPAESEAGLSFAALTDLVRGVDADLINGLPELQRRALRVAMLDEPPEASALDLRTVASGLLGVVRAVAARGAVLIAIDDVQWLDPASRAAVEFVVRRLDGESVGLLLGVRQESDEPLPLDLGPNLDPERLTNLALGPLSAAALYQLLRVRLGRSFARPTLVRIAEWSGGNPLFAIEIGRTILAAGGVIDPTAPPPVPRDLGRALGTRIGALPRDERRTLLVAACASRPTEARVSEVCLALGWRMKLPQDATLLRSSGTSLLFGHPLIAAEAIAIAPVDERRATHRALASLAEDPEERARHLALATPGPDEAVAAAVDEGARRADLRGASEAAIDLAELACRLTPADDIASATHRRGILGELLLRAGESARAADVLRSAVADTPPGPERALVSAVLAEALVQSGSTAEARALCRQAREESGPDALVRARVELTWSRSSVDAREGLDHAEAALALLGSGPADLRARALAGVASWLSRLGEPVPLELLDEAVALEAAAPPKRLIDGARASRAWLQMMADELDVAHAEYEQLRERAEALGDESSLARILVELAQIDLRAGRWGELESHATTAVRVADRAGRGHDRAMAAIQLGAVAAARGDRELAELHLGAADAFGISAGDPMIRAIVAGNRGVLALTEDAPGAAHELFTFGERQLADAHLADEALMRYQADRIEALVELGRVDEAAAQADAIEVRATANRRRRPKAFVDRGLGLIAAARGDLDGSLAYLDRSAEALTGLGMRFEAARSLLVRGIVHRRRREKRRAHDDLSAAVRTFDELGATAWSNKARRELGRIGLRPRARRELTDTESTVARLAAEGHTNREIAALAFMSPRTVEGVLARVYAKLAIGSRAELGRVFGSATNTATNTAAEPRD